VGGIGTERARENEGGREGGREEEEEERMKLLMIVGVIRVSRCGSPEGL
jgi:hypothetical protein